jgi:hypothetical protein
MRAHDASGLSKKVDQMPICGVAPRKVNPMDGACRPIRRNRCRHLCIRTDNGDDAGYNQAAEAMVELARTARISRHRFARGDDGIGITVSYWADDEAAAKAWRDNTGTCGNPQSWA